MGSVLCDYVCFYCFRILLLLYSLLLSAADLPTSDISTKRIKLAEEEEQSEKGEETSAQEKVWPEPPKRVSPPIRTAVVLPNGVACPDGCERFSSSEDPDPLIVSKLRYAAVAAHGSFQLALFRVILYFEWSLIHFK